MTTYTNLSDDLKKDLQRNRDGRLSSRQWMQLITEPLTTLLLLAVPMILLIGRAGIAGRYIVLLVVAGFGIMSVLRAIRFARAKLHYRTLYIEQSQPRWKLWKQTQWVTKTGDPLVFQSRVCPTGKLQPDQAVMAYYIEVAERRILLSILPEKHPDARSATPTYLFQRHGGHLYKD